MKIKGLSLKETEALGSKKIKPDEWRRQLMKYIVTNTTKYINDILQNKTRLPFAQSEIRQIFLNKDKDNLQHFSNNRPISISSVMYKMVENVIDLKMKQEEKSKNIQINYNQIGFKQHLGCEMNILKLT